VRLLSVFRKYEEPKSNPGFENSLPHDDLWEAINKCRVRIAVVDERVRVALLFCVPGVITANGLLLAILLRP
jgi:hypothetical protein